jgi:hypothetical protein
VEQERAIGHLVDEGHGATQIYRELERLGLLDHPHSPLTQRTVQRRVSALKRRDTSGPWSFTDADPDEARLVLDVLLDTHQWTDGRVWLSKEVAHWVTRVRSASPAIPLAWAYLFGLHYQRCAEHEDCRYLDLLLAAMPWEADRWTFEQWMHFIDMSPAPEKLLSLLLLGAYEIGPGGEYMKLRWMPHYDHWLTAKTPPLATFHVVGPPGQRQREWLP